MRTAFKRKFPRLSLSEINMKILGSLTSLDDKMALKASVDFGVDQRNHDPKRTWDEGYLEN